MVGVVRSWLVTWWTTVVPLIALALLAAVWARDLAPALAVLVAGSVLAAVHHAEVVAHRVGEPFGSLATMSLVLPTFTTSRPGPEFSPAQLGWTDRCCGAWAPRRWCCWR